MKRPLDEYKTKYNFCICLDFSAQAHRLKYTMPKVRPLRVNQFFFPPVFCHLNIVPGFGTKKSFLFYIGCRQVEFSLVQNRSSVVLNEVSQQP